MTEIKTKTLRKVVVSCARETCIKCNQPLETKYIETRIQRIEYPNKVYLSKYDKLEEEVELYTIDWSKVQSCMGSCSQRVWRKSWNYGIDNSYPSPYIFELASYCKDCWDNFHIFDEERRSCEKCIHTICWECGKKDGSTNGDEFFEYENRFFYCKECCDK